MTKAFLTGFFIAACYFVNPVWSDESEDCEIAFNDMLSSNGANIWKKNLVDHCEGGSVIGKSCFSCSPSDLIPFLQANNCNKNFYGSSGKKAGQTRCEVSCDKEIGFISSGALSQTIFFTIQPSKNPQRDGSDFLIFNIYPN